MSRLYVKPAEVGAIVRDPVTQRPVPPEGRYVPDNSFWRRRLRDVDVVLTDPPTKAAKPSPPAKPASEAKE